MQGKQHPMIRFTDWLVNLRHGDLLFLSLVTFIVPMVLSAVGGVLVYQSKMLFAVGVFLTSWGINGVHTHIELAHLTKSIREEFNLTMKK